jgi:hypothetical protein
VCPRDLRAARAPAHDILRATVELGESRSP